jgi:hypothetical protein
MGKCLGGEVKSAFVPDGNAKEELQLSVSDDTLRLSADSDGECHRPQVS